MPNGPTPSRWTRILIGVVITAAVIGFIVLHLSGAIGPGTH
jgi:hypothetical protein